MKKYISLLLVLMIVAGSCACGQKETAPTWQEQYDLGVRYLSEGNYQEAIIAFTAAIEIDPKQPEAYISLADAYIGAGDYDKANSIIQQGREACGELEGFSRLENNLSFLQSGDVGIRITEFYFDKQAFLAGEETDFLVSVAYRCPEEECILMIGANTEEPYSFRMMDEDYLVTGSGGYQFHVSVTPVQWDNAYFGIYVNLSEANHAESWTPFDSDTLYIDPAGNVVSDAPYVEGNYDNHGDSLLAQGVTDNMVRADEVLFLGNPIAGLDINTVESILSANGFEVTSNGDHGGTADDYWWIQGSLDGSAHISALQYKNEDFVTLWGYDDYGDYQDNLPIGIRDIYTEDTLATVLTKLGFSNGAEVSSLIDDLADQEFSSHDDIYSALSRYLEGWHSGFSTGTSDMQSTVLDDGKNRLHGFGLNIHFEDLPGYWITLSFGGHSSAEFMPTLTHYSVSFHG